MTLLAEDGDTGAGRGDVDSRFTELYAEHYDRLWRHLYFRLPFSHRQVAEDLVQETFIAVWREMQEGKFAPTESAFGLLRFIAHNKVASYFRRLTNRSQTAVDFSDPTNTPVIAGHRYAASEPGLAAVSADLDASMERMQDASKVWRNLHSLIYRDRQALAHGVAGKTLTPATRRLKEQRLAASEQAEPEALTRFQEACMRVAELRAELEAAAPYWNSGTGMAPATVSLDHAHMQRHGVRSDLDLTHCHNGHRLTRDNIHFNEDGSRACRQCRHDRALQKTGQTATPLRCATTSDEVLDAARALLLDPGKDDLLLKQIAELAGLHTNTIISRLPDAVAARRERRGNLSYRKTDPAVWERARVMLLDPQCDLTVEQVAESVGLSFTALYKAIPEVLAQRTAARQEAARAAEAAVRTMLLDPANTMSIKKIAAAAGMSETSVHKRLPDAVAARRERLATAKQAKQMALVSA
ncbi:sigma factor [Streptomyces sp. NPDC047939]|uniref:RNA polymerase sigma factor n=1 Tax=Streptomyces sp. NPDC047939 TaxID=3155381 RepID=UPI003427C218